jgi:DNA-binding MarR family transcriptional regulator
VNLRLLYDDLIRFETVLWNTIDARLRAQAGLSLGALEMLLVVDQTPDCRVQEVADSLAITVGGASQGVDRLERQGWCARRPNPKNRRSSVLELTPAGRSLLATAGTRFDQELKALLGDPLTDSEVAALSSALHKLRAATGSGRSEPPPS